MTVSQATILSNITKLHGDRPAVSLGKEVQQTYGQLSGRASRLAGHLRQKLGCMEGDRVAIIMKNQPQYFECLYGIWWAGLAAVPVNAKLHQKEFAYILENSGARLVFASWDLAEVLAPLVEEIDSLERVICVNDEDYETCFAGEPLPAPVGEPDDLAWLFYTSGTTGRPKGAMLTNRNLNSMVMNYFADVDMIEAEDCMIHCAPLSHGSGIYGLCHVAKGANNILPLSGGFDPAECFDLITAWPGATFFFAPTMISRLINSAPAKTADTRNLKTIVYGGGPMYVEDTLAALELLGPKLVQIYGQGEAPMTITGLPKSMHGETDHPDFLQRLGSAGFARTDVAVRIVDEADCDVPLGESGEVICRGDIVMAGYWDNPQASAETLRGGWLHTGDMGSMDEKGFVTLKDRAKDMIISGGSNIYPREIEEVLLRHPGVLECSVVGRPHPDWGEEVIAFVTPRQGEQVDPESLDQLCLDNIARFKRPKEYRIMAALPKNNYGKILKTELRELLASEAGEG